VARLEETFLRSDGDLGAVMRALVDSPEAWTTPYAKFKRPEEYLISTLRAVNIRQLNPGVGAFATASMGQRLYLAPGPDGWADTAAPWLTGDLVWKRIEWAEQLAQLRALEHGLDIAVAVRTVHSTGIDTPEQYDAFVRRWGSRPT
jgi:uncharacterized protein (DUF1800 family)